MCFSQVSISPITDKSEQKSPRMKVIAEKVQSILFRG
jgi:hypothetical protein